jgi:hypothetical protein
MGPAQLTREVTELKDQMTRSEETYAVHSEIISVSYTIYHGCHNHIKSPKHTLKQQTRDDKLTRHGEISLPNTTTDGPGIASIRMLYFWS